MGTVMAEPHIPLPVPPNSSRVLPATLDDRVTTFVMDE
jgi:hypothetical protein